MLRSMKYGTLGAVLAGLVAAPVVWLSVDKTVHLVVDGHGSTVRTTAADVGELLASRGYHADAHDLVAPAPNAALHNGMRVVLRRGRLLHLNVDGTRRNVWTTARTVEAALGQLGYSTQDFVSVSRSERLPLSPSDLTIRTPRSVTLVHDGRREHLTSTDATVGALLSDLGIALHGDDKVRPGLGAPLTDGERIVITRVDKSHIVRRRTLDFPTIRRNDPQLRQGTTRVAQTGRDGLEKITYAVVYLNGKQVARTRIDTVVVRRPRPQIIRVGTKPVPVTTEAASNGSRHSGGSGASGSSGHIATPAEAQAMARQMVADRGWSSDQFDCLVTLWNHESGWSVTAENPSGAYGIPQALPGSKMSSAGPNWQTNAHTQITWGLDYIASRYGTPCGAWAQWQANGGWY
ncbi:MAG TPA: ubiquitin-like domain-containing protein [Jatrophihabitans sp.]|nr:ubiquitin-like domain-containing protein [Jatrophihabitans sp.]